MGKILSVVGVVVFIIFAGGVAGAIPISVSVHLTVSNAPSYIMPGLQEGELVHLFDVVYDNEGTVIHSFWDSDDSVADTFQLSDYPAYVFFDDATFTLSPIIAAAIRTYGGNDREITYMDHVQKRIESDGEPHMFYNTKHDDYHLSVGHNMGSSDYIYGHLRVYSDTGYTTVEFHEPGGIEATAAVPEPATMLLLGVGLVCFAGYGRRMRSEVRGLRSGV